MFEGIMRAEEAKKISRQAAKDLDGAKVVEEIAELTELLCKFDEEIKKSINSGDKGTFFESEEYKGISSKSHKTKKMFEDWLNSYSKAGYFVKKQFISNEVFEIFIVWDQESLSHFDTLNV